MRIALIMNGLQPFSFLKVFGGFKFKVIYCVMIISNISSHISGYLFRTYIVEACVMSNGKTKNKGPYFKFKSFDYYGSSRYNPLFL